MTAWQLLVCDDSSVAIARSIWNLRAPPRPWSSLLSGTDETEFYRQLALFTAFLEPITRLSPPHQPRVSTHWRTVKNLLSLSCSPQELGAMERILLSLLKWMKRRIESSKQVSLQCVECKYRYVQMCFNVLVRCLFRNTSSRFAGYVFDRAKWSVDRELRSLSLLLIGTLRLDFPTIEIALHQTNCASHQSVEALREAPETNFR